MKGWDDSQSWPWVFDACWEASWAGSASIISRGRTKVQHEGSRSHPQDSTGRHCPVGKVLIQHEANPIVQFFAAETLSDSPNNRKARYFSLPKKNFDSVSSVWMDAFVLLKPFTVFRVYVDANILIQHMGIFSPEQ